MPELQSLDIVANASKESNLVHQVQIIGINNYRLAENTNALKLLKEHLKVFAYSRKMFNFILPGSEIPEWFTQQRGDSSIKIHLSTNIRNDSQWTGVAFCLHFCQ